MTPQSGKVDKYLCISTAEAQITNVNCSISWGGGKELWVVYHMLSYCDEKPIYVLIWCTSKKIKYTVIIAANSKNPHLIVNLHVPKKN